MAVKIKGLDTNSNLLAKSINGSVKELLDKYNMDRLDIYDAIKLVKLFRDLQKLPEVTKENCLDTNIHIILDTREELMSRLKINHGYFDVFINYGLIKLASDGFYSGVVNWFLKELLRRGWQFPDYNVPSLKHWHVIPKDKKSELKRYIYNKFSEIQNNYDKVSPPEKEQMIDRFSESILTEVGIHVDSWGDK